MDGMVWVDTMFPGLDESQGWEENLKRVINYDYQLKEFLDWQLKHLNTDNFDSVDWSNVQEEIISLAAGQIDLSAYYTKDEADSQAALTLSGAQDYADAKLTAYYTAAQVDGKLATADTALKAYADAAVASIDLSAYYTSAQVDSAISTQAGLTLTAAEAYADAALTAKIGDLGNYATVKAYADAAVAGIDLSAYYTTSQVDGMFSAAETALKAYADAVAAGAELSSYYTKTEMDTLLLAAEASLKEYADDAAANIDLSAYYTSAEVDAELADYYTKTDADAAISAAVSAQAGLTLQASKDYTDAELVAYYTSSQVDGMFTSSEATLKQYADAAVANIDLSAYYTSTQVDSAISSQAQLTLTAAEGYADAQLTAKIGDLGNYATVKAYADAAVANIDLSAYYTSTQVEGRLSEADASLKAYVDAVAAGADLSSYYTKTQMDVLLSAAEASLKEYADDAVANLDLSAYYTSSQVNSAISSAVTAQAALTLQAAKDYTDVGLSAYYTSSQVDGMFTTSEATLKQYADDAVASIDLSVYYTKTQTDSAISSAVTTQAGLTLAAAEGYADAQLSAKIGDLGNYATVKAYTDAAVSNIDLSAYYTSAEVDAEISSAVATQAGLTLTAAESYADAQLTAKIGDLGNYATVKAYADAAVANIDLSAYYTSAQADAAILSAVRAQAGLTLDAAESYTQAQLRAYYTADQVEGKLATADTALKAYADAAVAGIDLSAYYTSAEVDAAISSEAQLILTAAASAATAQLNAKIGDLGNYATVKAYTDAAVSNIDLSAYYTSAEVDAEISSAVSTQAGLTLTAAESYADAQLSAKIGNLGSATVKAYADALISGLTLEASNSKGSSVLTLKSNGVTIASSGGITLGGSVVFQGDDISDLNNDAGYQTGSGVTTIIGDTVTTSYINALDVTAAAIRATGNDGAYVYGATSGDSDYMLVYGGGFDLVYDSMNRAKLWYTDDAENTMTLRLGNNTFAYVQKYYTGNKHYMWIGGGVRGNGGVGLRLNLSDNTYKLFGTPEP